MRLMSLAMAVVMCISLIYGFSIPAIAEGPGPVPACPWPITIENAPPGTPDNIRALLDEWSGQCQRDSKVLCYYTLIIFKVQESRAWLYYGWGSSATDTTAGSMGFGPNWIRVEAEISQDNGSLSIKWQGERSGNRKVFTLSGEKLDKLVSDESTWGGHWLTTILSKTTLPR